MATINFFIQGKQNPTKIYVRVRDGAYIDSKAPTNHLIFQNDWSKKKGQPKNLKIAKFKKLNSNLLKIKNDILEQFNDAPNKNLNSNWLKEIITPKKIASDIPEGLLNYIDFYISAKKNELKNSSLKKFSSVKQKLIRFEESMGEKILIANVNLDFKTKFINYCTDNLYSKNTISRDVKFIKTFCKHARQQGLKTDIQLDLLKSKPEKAKTIYLNNEELIKIIELDLNDKESLDNARDWLIILCYSAQRVSDALNFTSQNIREQENLKFLDFTQKKTGKIMTIPLLPQINNILEKRDGEFPRKISDVKLNKYIKLVCKLAEIDEEVDGSLYDKETKRKKNGRYSKWMLVTSHIGRRSFATNYYGSSIPTALLISMTGHSSESQFLEYIGKSKTDSALELAKLFNTNL